MDQNRGVASTLQDVSIVLFADRSLLREGLAGVLERVHARVAVISPEEPRALDRLGEIQPKVILLGSPDLGGSMSVHLQQIQSICPTTTVLRYSLAESSLETESGDHIEIGSAEEFLAYLERAINPHVPITDIDSRCQQTGNIAHTLKKESTK